MCVGLHEPYVNSAITEKEERQGVGEKRHRDQLALFIMTADFRGCMCKPDSVCVSLSFNPTAKTTSMCSNCCVVKGTISTTERVVSALRLPVRVHTRAHTHTHIDPLARMFVMTEKNSSA